MSERRFWTPAEDEQLARLAGRKTAAEIAIILDRPKGGVQHRIAKLGLSGRLYGETHWASKMPDLVRMTIQVLHNNGFTLNEIRRLLRTEYDLAEGTVLDIICGRARTVPTKRSSDRCRKPKLNPVTYSKQPQGTSATEP